MCSCCSARSCTGCYQKALEHQLLDVKAMAKPILCPKCRVPMLPSFSQIVKDSRLLNSITWGNDVNSYAEFWRLVGRSVPSKGLSRFIICMYSLAANLRMRMLQVVEEYATRQDVIARLRPRSADLTQHEHLQEVVSAVTTDFDECPPWIRPQP